MAADNEGTVALAKYAGAVFGKVIHFVDRAFGRFPASEYDIGVERMGNAGAAPVAGNGYRLAKGYGIWEACSKQTSPPPAVRADFCEHSSWESG